jgi:hypothetical protein
MILPIYAYLQDENRRLRAVNVEMLDLVRDALNVALVHELPLFEQRCRRAIARAEAE